MEKKRERNVNFTQEETDLLVSLAEAKKYVLENKKSDATTWKEKEKAWIAIETAFNSSSGSVFRSHKHLKLKYDSLKKNTRKKSAAIRAERYKTGEGASAAPLLTSAELKLKEMILLSVQGNKSSYDSDAVPSTSSSEAIAWTPDQSIITEQTLADDTPIIINLEESNEPPKKKVSGLSKIEEALEDKAESASQTNESTQKWKDWTPIALKTKKHPGLCKPKEKKPFDILTEKKIKLAKLQENVLVEELTLKKIQNEIYEKELEYKNVLFELNKQNLLLKQKILEKELEKHS